MGEIILGGVLAAVSGAISGVAVRWMDIKEQRRRDAAARQERQERERREDQLRAEEQQRADQAAADAVRAQRRQAVLESAERAWHAVRHALQPGYKVDSERAADAGAALLQLSMIADDLFGKDGAEWAGKALNFVQDATAILVEVTDQRGVTNQDVGNLNDAFKRLADPLS